jgi:hypothetical protein
MIRTRAWLTVLLGVFASEAQPGFAKGDKEAPGAVALLEDATGDFIAQLTNEGGADAAKATRDFRDFYSGVCSLRVTPFQRFSTRLKGWSFRIAEKPQPGQYRYLRFAWKRIGGEGIMIQMHNTAGTWNQRYFAGNISQTTMGWGRMMKVADKMPLEWTVVTRDLFKDFGSMTIEGFAFTPMEGGTAGYFDHLYLGRTVKDLDDASAAAFGKNPLGKALSRQQMEKLWDDLISRDVTVAGPAVRTFVAGRKDTLPFLLERLGVKPARPTAKRILRLIEELDHDEFQVRAKAFGDLERLGDSALPFLRKALKDASSVEVKRQIETLLKRHDPAEWALPSEHLRIMRVIRILEWSGTAEARQALERLIKNPSAAGLESDVRAALERLKKRA